MKISPPYRPYIGRHFILSGYIFWFVGKAKIPSEQIKRWEEIKIANKDLKRVYFWLELQRKIKGFFK